ncbi:ribosome biogenesis protein ytm1, partial [Spiromyces aspiralis]
LLTGSADGTLMVWTTEVPDESEITESKPVTKRAKAEQHAANIVLKAPLATCRDHVGAVTAVSFNRSSDKQAFSGGWDHSVRTWDMEICTNVTTRVCEKVVLSVDHSSQNGLLASGHADKNIRLWDTRADDTSMVKLSLLGHSSWVPSVRWSPTSPYMLASASHDGSLRVWDIRSRTPLHTIKPSGSDAASTRVSHARHERLLALEWSHGFLATGGESGKLSIYQVQ